MSFVLKWKGPHIVKVAQILHVPLAVQTISVSLIRFLFSRDLRNIRKGVFLVCINLLYTGIGASIKRPGRSTVEYPIQTYSTSILST